MSSSVRALRRWWAQPWRSPLTLAALIVGLAAPVLMVAASQLFRSAAGDTVAREQIAADLDEAGLTITMQGRLAAAPLAEMQDVLETQVGAIDGVGPLDRVLVTPSLGLSVEFEPDGAPAPVVPGSGAIVVVREGAIDALEAVDRVDEPGVWLSETRAERLGVAAGDPVLVEGTRDVTVVAGVYRDLWRPPRAAYWEELPPNLVPQYSSVFNGASREIYVVDLATADALGLAGVARWDADLVVPPDTLPDLRVLVSEYRLLERAATADDDYAAAVAAFGGPGSAVPAVDSMADETLVEVERRVDDIEAPLVATTLAGFVLGLVACVAGAVFVVSRRRREYDLMRSDGDGPLRLFVGALGQYAPVAVVAAVIGVVVAIVLAQVASPFDRVRVGTIDVSTIVAVAAVGTLALALTIAAAASAGRSASRPAVRTLVPWLLPVAALAAAAWIQVGREGQRGVVDPLVVIFPIVAIVTGVGIVAIGVAWVLRRIRGSGQGLPPVLFLAWRRLGAAGLGAVALSVAVGAAIGLLAYGALLTRSLGEAVEAKVLTEVGGDVQVVLNGDLAELPPDSTVIRRQTTRLTVGGRQVLVLAIDPDTFADATSIHPVVGTTPAELVDLLAQPVDAEVAAVVVGDATVPSDVGFGTTSVFGFDVVGRVAAAPLARSTLTLVVDADRIEQIGLDRHRAQRPPDVDPEAWDAEYRSVLGRSRPVLVSSLPVDEVLAALEAQGANLATTTSRVEALDRLENRAAVWSFDHLRLLAVVAATAALAGLVLYLAQRRRQRELSAALAERMGMARTRSIAASVTEVVGLSIVAIVAGITTAIVVADHVFARFEPDPAIPPTVELIRPVAPLAAIAGGAVVAVAAVAVVAELSARRRSFAEVLRGS